MKSAEDYNAKLEVIQAIPEDQLKTLHMPVDAYLQEAENLYIWSQDDKEALEAKGLSWTLVEDIPTRSGALRHAESLWNRERFSREDAEKMWLKESPLAYDLRDELLYHLRFAFRLDESLLNRVGAIAEGYSQADMIQDLNDLSVLGMANSNLLAEINFDMTLLDEAAEKAKAMAALLGETTRDRADYNDVKRIRDQAYTHLKEAVDELYGFGQYVFYHNEDRLRGYRSKYKFKQRKNTTNTTQTTPTTEENTTPAETNTQG